MGYDLRSIKLSEQETDFDRVKGKVIRQVKAIRRMKDFNTARKKGNKTEAVNQIDKMMKDIYYPHSSTFRWNISSWEPVLELAQKYGWIPLGTINEREEDKSWIGEWNGNYDENGGQVVTDQDAYNLSNALEKALGDESVSDELVIDKIQSFICFCKNGAFEIR